MGKKAKAAAGPPPLDPKVAEAINLLKDPGTSSVESKEEALEVIVGAAAGCDVIRMDAVSAGALDPLLNMIEVGDTEQMKESAVFALRQLSSGNFLHVAYDNPSAIVAARGVQRLVSLISTTSNTKAKEHGAATLCNLATSNANRTSLVEEGAVGPLLLLVQLGTELEAVQAAFAIGGIAFAHKSNQESIQGAGGIESLRALQKRFPESPKVRQVSEYALKVLTDSPKRPPE